MTTYNLFIRDLTFATILMLTTAPRCSPLPGEFLQAARVRMSGTDWPTGLETLSSMT